MAHRTPKPAGKRPDALPGDNEKELLVKCKTDINLSVRLTEYPAKQRKGQPAQVKGVVECNTSDLIHTNLEWLVNGERHFYTEDLIFRDKRDPGITFNMPQKTQLYTCSNLRSGCSQRFVPKIGFERAVTTEIARHFFKPELAGVYADKINTSSKDKQSSYDVQKQELHNKIKEIDNGVSLQQ